MPSEQLEHERASVSGVRSTSRNAQWGCGTGAADQGSDPKAVVEAWADREDLIGILRDQAGLSPLELEIYVLREAEQLSYREIAERLGLKVGTIGPVLTDARRKVENLRLAAAR